MNNTCDHILDKNHKRCVLCGMPVLETTFRPATPEEKKTWEENPEKLLIDFPTTKTNPNEWEKEPENMEHWERVLRSALPPFHQPTDPEWWIKKLSPIIAAAKKEEREQTERKVREEIAGKIENRRDCLIGKSTHGNCCSCVKCHNYHDECRCREIEELEKILSLLTPNQEK